MPSSSEAGRARDEMRHIAKDLCGRGMDVQSRFAVLLSDDEPLVGRWAGLHVLELCELGDDVEARAVQAIASAAAMSPPDEMNDTVWLRRWRASRGTREEFVGVLCRLPVDYHEANLAPVDLVRAARFARQAPAAAGEVEACLRGAPELVDAWLQYSEDQRCTPAWFVAERADGRYELGRVPSGTSEWFTDRVEAIAAFAARNLRELCEHAG